MNKLSLVTVSLSVLVIFCCSGGITAKKYKSRYSDTHLYTYKDLIVVGEEPADKIYWMDIPWKNPTFIEVREGQS